MDIGAVTLKVSRWLNHVDDFDPIKRPKIRTEDQRENRRKKLKAYRQRKSLLMQQQVQYKPVPSDTQNALVQEKISERHQKMASLQRNELRASAERYMPPHSPEPTHTQTSTDMTEGSGSDDHSGSSLTDSDLETEPTSTTVVHRPSVKSSQKGKGAAVARTVENPNSHESELSDSSEEDSEGTSDDETNNQPYMLSDGQIVTLDYDMDADTTADADDEDDEDYQGEDFTHNLLAQENNRPMASNSNEGVSVKRPHEDEVVDDSSENTKRQKTDQAKQWPHGAAQADTFVHQTLHRGGSRTSNPREDWPPFLPGTVFESMTLAEQSDALKSWMADVDDYMSLIQAGAMPISKVRQFFHQVNVHFDSVAQTLDDINLAHRRMEEHNAKVVAELSKAKVEQNEVSELFGKFGLPSAEGSQ